MDDEVRDFVTYVEWGDPWAAITEPVARELTRPRRVEAVAPDCYAAIHAFAWSLDDSLGLIGRLLEIDRRIAVIERRLSHG